MKNEAQFDDARWHLNRAQHPVDYLIAATPTGPIRNALTEANIHLMIAFKNFESARILAINEAERTRG